MSHLIPGLLRSSCLRRLLRATVLAGLLLHVTPGLAAYRGRSLVEVLNTLRERGLNIVFSSAVVANDLVVSIEPVNTEPRLILDEVLGPVGLAARAGPSGSILIVPAGSATATLRGRVLSATRNTPIAGSLVRISGANLERVVNPVGTFKFDPIPPGTHEVTFEAVGFVTKTMGAVPVGPGGTARLTVALDPKPGFVERIVVIPGRHAVVREEQTSRVTLEGRDALLVPTFGGDVSRLAEHVPGIAAADNSAAFHVRGSDTRDVSFVLDGLELYEPYHLRDFQSPFSMIAADIIDRTEVLKGGFTAEFGDRHGGFVELATTYPVEPNRTRVELGTLNSSVTYGTTTPTGSFLISARAWYPEVLRDTIQLGETGLDPRFGDLYAKYSWNASPKTLVSAHALFGHDGLTYEETGGNETVKARAQTGYLWARVFHAWTPSLSGETVISTGYFKRSRRGDSEPEHEIVTVDDERDVNFVGLKQDLAWEASPSQLLKAGVLLRRLAAKYRYDLNDTAGGSTRSIRLDPTGTALAAYIAYRTGLTSRAALEFGARWDRQAWNETDQWSPRLNAIWRIGARSELKAALGRYFQSQRIHELHVEEGETAFQPAESSRQVELTFEHDFSNGVRLRVDAYDRELSQPQTRYENLFDPLELFPETEADRVAIAPDAARFRGVEISLAGTPARPLTWWIGYTWSYASDVIDGNEVPRSWDQTNAGRFLVGYRWDDRWSVSVSGSAHTGWPTTPVSAVVTTLPDGSTQIDPVVGPRNSTRFPLYARLDVKGSRAFTLAKGRLSLDLEIINVTDRDNVCCVDDFVFTPLAGGGLDSQPEFSYWLGFTPSFNVTWEF